MPTLWRNENQNAAVQPRSPWYYDSRDTSLDMVHARCPHALP